jgi:peroxiredoxin
MATDTAVGTGRQVVAGDTFPALELETMRGEPVRIPDLDAVVHLQLRRFAGCPVCSLHLRSIVQRHDEIAAAGVREVVVFHSSPEDLRRYEADLPFAAIPDPKKRLYAMLGAEAHPKALLHPRAWLPILRAVVRSIGAIVRGAPVPPVFPKGGRTSLPADILIAPDGRVLASKYGEHVHDQWTVDELLAHAATAGAGAAD